MQRVYKYPLAFAPWVTLRIPETMEPLCVQTQNDEPMLWVRVDPESAPRTCHFRIAGTGHDLGNRVGKYIDTFQISNGEVYHVFAED